MAIDCDDIHLLLLTCEVGGEVLGLLDDLMAEDLRVPIQTLLQHPCLVEVEVLPVLADDALHHLVAQPQGEVGLGVVDGGVGDVVELLRIMF